MCSVLSPVVGHSLGWCPSKFRWRSNMAFGGKLITASRKQVPGSYQQHAWHDSWQESIDIDYDGELTAEVQAAIKRVFMERMAVKGGSLNGVLRAPMENHLFVGQRVHVLRSLHILKASGTRSMFDGSHLCCGWRGLAFMGRRNQVNTGLIIVIGIAVVFIGFPVLLVLFSASLIALAALWLFALQAVATACRACSTGCWHPCTGHQEERVRQEVCHW